MNDPAVQEAPLTRPLPTRRRKSITNERWEQARPLLKHLYEQRGLQLKHVKTIMESERHFSATEQMYKKRFARWKMRKYYTREFKEYISATMLEYFANKHPIMLPAASYSALHLRRIKRYMCEQGLPHKIVNFNEPEAVGGRPSRQRPQQCLADGSVQHIRTQQDLHKTKLCHTEEESNFQSPPSLVQRTNLIPDGQALAIEDVLRSARQYYRWFFTRTDFAVSLFERPQLDAVFIRAQCARRLMAGGDYARAFLMLELACENIRGLFLRQPFQLFLECFRTFGRPGWTDFTEVKNAVLIQMMLMSQAVLGSTHPLSKLAELFLNADSATEAGPRFFRLLSDVVDECLGQSDQASSVQLILAECYIALDDLETAERICLKYVPGDKYELEASISSHSIQKARKNLGCIRYRQGYLHTAEQIWLDVHKKEVTLCRGKVSSSDAVINCTHLASLYEGQGDYQRSSTFYDLAFEGALETWGPVIVDLHEYYNSLQDTLARAGATWKLSKLLADHQSTMQQWDSKQIKGVGEREGLADSLLACGHGSGRKQCDFDAGGHRHFVC